MAATSSSINLEETKRQITSILSTILKDFKNNLVDPGIIDDLRSKIKVLLLYIKFNRKLKQ